MRTITVLMHSRPELLEQTMGELLRCQDLDKFDKLIFSIDGGHQNSPRCTGIAQACAELFTNQGVIDCEVISHSTNLGIASHAGFAMHNALMQSEASINLSLEDDALVKPDLLRLVLWWERSQRELFPDSALVAGSNHRDYGRGQHSEVPEDDPSLIAESAHIPSPFCWATTDYLWFRMEKWWSFKQNIPSGWDYSLSMWMRLFKYVAVHPVLSRCQNIGGTGGAHESPDTFSKTQAGLKYRENEYDGPYRLAVKVDREDLLTLDDWMKPEVERMSGKPL